MARNLTTSGDYTIDAGTNDIKLTASDVTITGNLAVTGATTTITTTNTAITDNVIVLNKDERAFTFRTNTALPKNPNFGSKVRLVMNRGFWGFDYFDGESWEFM